MERMLRNTDTTTSFYKCCLPTKHHFMCHENSGNLSFVSKLQAGVLDEYELESEDIYEGDIGSKLTVQEQVISDATVVSEEIRTNFQRKFIFKMECSNV